MREQSGREKASVLVVEDEPALVETLQYNLERAGYRVYTAGDGVTALEVARREQPDLILLDIMLPGMDGYDVCRLLRREMDVPILMLTARDEEIDKLLGLEIGADDYITKPFSMRELMARVKAHLRQAERLRAVPADGDADSPQVLRAGDVEIDLSRREVRRAGRLQPLKPKEFDLLVFFARNRGKVLSREEILSNVWGWSFSGGSRTVDVHVRWLRQKIEEDPKKPARIVTVRNAGYRFEG